MVTIEKDRGYGWVIVLTSFTIQFIGLGVNTTFGLFLEQINKDFPQIGEGGTSWVPSLLTSLAHAVGPGASILVHKFGIRKVSILGSVLTALGFGLSYFAPNASVLYITIGVFGGIGMGLLYLPSMVVIPKYFDKKLAFATGIAVSGSGVGTIFFEWSFGLTLTYLSWREGLLITGIIFLICLPLSLLYKPFKEPEWDDDGASTPLVLQDSGLELEGKEKNVLIDLNLLRNIVFILFITADLLTSFAFNIPQIYLPEIEHTITNSNANSLLGFIALPMVCTRLLLGYFSDKPWVNRHLLYTLSLAITGITTAISPQLDTINWLRVYCALYGACIGVYLGLKSVILVDLMGTQKMIDAFGLLLLVQAIGMFFGAPVAGYFYDQFGNHRNGFYFAGGMFFMSAIVLTFIPRFQRQVKETSVTGGLLKNEDKNNPPTESQDSNPGGYSTFS